MPSWAPPNKLALKIQRRLKYQTGKWAGWLCRFWSIKVQAFSRFLILDSYYLKENDFSGREKE
jgi:hypothetical protein